jgi:penicillin-binding protein 1A
VTDVDGGVVYEAPRLLRDVGSIGITSAQLTSIQEGLRGVVRLRGGTAHELDARTFPIPVMGKTGTTTAFRDALFVGSTYGEQGITVAVRIGFDDNRELGDKETGGRAALPIFREVVLGIYGARLTGPVPRFPREIEEGIDEYLNGAVPPAAEVVADAAPSPCFHDGAFHLPCVRSVEGEP